MLLSNLFLPLLAAGLQAVHALHIDVNDPASILNATTTIVRGIFDYYSNALVANSSLDWQIGTFPYPPYYWWESGAVWGGVVDYITYTGDATYLNFTLDALYAQVGPNNDFVVPEETWNEANDDQAFWVFAALSALENGLPNLVCPDGEFNWGSFLCPTHYLRLADNAFNDYVARWHNASDTCGGGLRWQYTPGMAGWTYKNAISNGGFFQIAARLARYTGNATYADWASTVYDWSAAVGLVSGDFHVFDGTDDSINCTGIDHLEWSYNLGTYLHGAAAMYNYTDGGAEWGARVAGLLNTAQQVFFSPFANATGVMYEQACETPNTCTTDQDSFKAYLARGMAKTSVLAPFTAQQVHGLLVSSSLAAARSCSGAADGVTCGTRWWVPGWDGTAGLGQQLSALETLQGLLVGSASRPRRCGEDCNVS